MAAMSFRPDTDVNAERQAVARCIRLADPAFTRIRLVITLAHQILISLRNGAGIIRVPVFSKEASLTGFWNSCQLMKSLSKLWPGVLGVRTAYQVGEPLGPLKLKPGRMFHMIGPMPEQIEFHIGRRPVKLTFKARTAKVHHLDCLLARISRVIQSSGINLEFSN